MKRKDKIKKLERRISDLDLKIQNIGFILPPETDQRFINYLEAREEELHKERNDLDEKLTHMEQDKALIKEIDRIIEDGNLGQRSINLLQHEVDDYLSRRNANTIPRKVAHRLKTICLHLFEDLHSSYRLNKIADALHNGSRIK